MTRVGALRKIVWKYYKEHGRHQLPWRLNLDPYAIVVSEVMLQQTQVERVVPKFEAWLKAFPNWQTLAKAPLPEMLKLWQGLGYNRRILNLQRCAQVVVKEYGGTLPRGEKELLALPGIGPYTAGAVRAFVFNESVTMIETNIRAVFLHHYFADKNKISDVELLPLITKTLDKGNPREWQWALMDYGSYLKKTMVNPARRSKHHTPQSTFAGSHRQVRGAIVRAVTRKARIPYPALKRALKNEGIEVAHIKSALTQLVSEGFITMDKGEIKVTATVSG